MKTEVDDWLTELPPLDGDDDEPESGDEVGDDPLPEPDDASSLDDAAADDLDVDIGVEIPDEEPATDGGKPRGEADDERWEADVGEPELDLVEVESAVGAEGEPPALTEGDFDDHEDLPDSDDDAGEEGTTDPIEHSLDQELPAMDADDEGDFEDALLLEAGEVAPDAESLRWADAAWSECSSLNRSFAWAVSERDPLVAMASAVAPDVVVGVRESGALWVSRDGGRTAARAHGVFEQLVAPTGNGEPAFVALATSPGGKILLWVGDRAGHLAVSHDYGDSFRPCAGVGRPIIALATREDGSLVVLARKGQTMELLTSTDGTTWFAQRVSGDVAALASPNLPRALWMACRGAAVAVGDNLGALHSRDGRHFTRVPATAGATAGVFAGAHDRAPLLLSGSFGDDDELHLVRIAHEALPEIVAEVAGAVFGASRGSSVVLGLVWLEEAGAVRVLLGGGSVVWGPPTAASSK